MFSILFVKIMFCFHSNPRRRVVQVVWHIGGPERRDW